MAQVITAVVLGVGGGVGLHLAGVLDDVWSWLTSGVITIPVWIALAFVVALVFLAWGTYQSRGVQRVASPNATAQVATDGVSLDDLSDLQTDFLHMFAMAGNKTQTAEFLAQYMGRTVVKAEHALEDLESKGLLFSRHSASRGTSYGLSREGKAFVVDHHFT